MERTTVDQRAPSRALLCLADAHELAEALADAGYEVAHPESGDTLTAVRSAPGLTVVVLEDGTPGLLRVISDIRHDDPDLAIVLVGTFDVADEFLAAVAAGVDGFCPADASVDAMLRTIRSVETSGVAIPRSMVKPLVEHVRHGRGRTVHTAAGAIEVTDREWDVLQLILQRRKTREMADELFVSVGTIRSHVSTLLKKLGAVDREDAIAMIDRGR